MKRNQALLFLLAAALTASLASCGGDSTTTTDTQNISTSDNASEAITEEIDPNSIEGRKLVSDDLGEKDFGGYEFRIVTSDGKTGHYWLEEATGDVVDDALFDRNTTVSDRFNCEISVIFDEIYYDTSAWITNQITAGDDAFDMASMQVIEISKLAVSNYLMNWYDVPHINFDKPWWSPSNKETLTLNDQCYVAIGDLDLSALAQTYCVFYNMSMGADYDLPDIYETVNAGTFTFDYIVSQAKNIYTDLNADGTRDNDDAYGYCTDSMSNLNTYLWAFNNPIFERDGDELKFVYKTEKLSNIIETLCDAFNTYEGFRQGGSGNWNYGYKQFYQSKTLFANGTLNHTQGLREMEDDYAILPYPKWDEAQEHHYTIVDGSHTGQAIPTTSQSLETVGTIVEALNAESYKQVVPVFYENALKIKGTRNAESIAMIDKLAQSRYFDFGYIYDGWKGCSFIVQDLISANNPNFASKWKSVEKQVMAHYQEIIDFHMENE